MLMDIHLGGSILETDISRKIAPIIKFALPMLLIIILGINFGIWAYSHYHRHISFYDVRVVGTLVNNKTLTNGTLEKVLIKDGQKVKAGQALAQIKPNVTQKDIENLQQAVQKAQEQYDNMVALSKSSTTRTVAHSSGPSAADYNQYQAAAAQASKMQQLYSIGAVSRAEYEAAAAAASSAQAALNASHTTQVVNTVPSGVTAKDIETAKTRLEQTKQALETAQKNTNLVSLEAAADGILYYTNIKIGSKITAGENIFNIGTSDSMWLEAKADKQQIVNIKKGAYADCSINGKDINGTVADIIAPAGKEKKYIIKIFIPSDKMDGIKPNMLATVNIAIQNNA